MRDLLLPPVWLSRAAENLCENYIFCWSLRMYLRVKNGNIPVKGGTFPHYLDFIYLFKVNKANTRTIIWNQLKKATPEWRHLHCSVVFIVNFEQISLIALVFPLLSMNYEQVHSFLYKNNFIRTKALILTKNFRAS